MTLPLFSGLRPVAAPPSIDLRCCDVREMLASVRGARLIVADPPWIYDQVGVRLADMDVPSAGGMVVYQTMSMPEIAAVIASAFDSADADARLLVWCTFPQLSTWMTACAGSRWRYVTGGAWGKTAGAFGSCGVGWHWRGRAEIALLYAKGSPPTDRSVHLSNHHVSPTTGHSEKPAAWMRQWIEAWTDPGDLVVDVFAGLAPLARACALSGRRYVGAEIDPDRHAMALTRLAAAISRGDL